MSAMWAKWAPKGERAILISLTYAGCQFGNVVTLPTSGLLCERGFAGGWPSIFYVFGKWWSLECVRYFMVKLSPIWVGITWYTCMYVVGRCRTIWDMNLRPRPSNRTTPVRFRRTSYQYVTMSVWVSHELLAINLRYTCHWCLIVRVSHGRRVVTAWLSCGTQCDETYNSPFGASRICDISHIHRVPH